MKKVLFISLLLIPAISSLTQHRKTISHSKTTIRHTTTSAAKHTILPGAYQTGEYVPMLKNKRVGIFANYTATIGNTHLIDTLQKLGIKITKIFGPEHGFRGTEDAGETVDTYTDSATGIPVISLYGKKRKPSAKDLEDVDVLLFDIQDIGTRYYTYISSLEEFLESAIENDKPLIILDRPNPNGFYVDGPVLDTAYKSFVGMQPIPVVYGMTIGEYALYLCGERLKWSTSLPYSFEALFTDDLAIRKKNKSPNYVFSITHAKEIEQHSDLFIILCKNYTHNSKYILPLKPSPNLPDMASVYWYPSTCLFEGTILSEGRGTDHPFCTIGHPSLPGNLYSFTPSGRDGAKNPKLKDQLCHGWNINGTNEEVLKQINNHLQLKYLIEAYHLFPDKENFFIKPKNDLPTAYGFNKLAGSQELMEQIVTGKTEEQIRASWQPKLNEFKEIRKKYLLYEDFNENKGSL